ncbi:branched-chain amino acid ABC transporter permease [Haloechinothrix aidingensis]|uniref:branched-chain amino acid ABC transporter permease n=1 Tax=Haloechinothrix aidingensis TaxID=2752311 RepID=UPI001C60D948
MRALAVIALIALAVLAPGAALADEHEAVQGTITDPDGEPLADLTITANRDGAEVGSDTTDEEGEWEIELPEPGSYDVELDLDTLPEGLAPREVGGEVLSGVEVDEGQQRTLIFQIVPEDEQEDPATEPEEPAEEEEAPPEGAETDSDTGVPGETETDLETPVPPQHAPFHERLAQVLLNGLQYGGIIAIAAVGLSLVFGTTRLINFAHGELVTFGAIVAFFVNAAAAGPGLHLILAIVVAVIAGALLGGGLDRGLWRPLRMRRTGRINMFIISIGLALFLRHLLLVIYGSRPNSYAEYQIQSTISLGWAEITPRDLTILVVSVIVLFAVALMLQRTRIGTAIRAVSDNRDLAASSGINVNYVILVVWMLAGGLSAFGGVMFGLTEVVSWDMGFKLLLLMFAGIILGGLGSAYGAMVGSFVVGIVAHLSTLWFPPELWNAWALLVLIVVLIVRPQGILGRKERVG